MSFSRPRPTLEAVVAAAFGYRDHVGVGQAIRRVEQGPDQNCTGPLEPGVETGAVMGDPVSLLLLTSHKNRKQGPTPKVRNGSRHPHWLEMLGYVRFSRN